MCHVLIIEDDAIAAMDIQGTLDAAGSHTFSFADTESGAVASAREQCPDVITSDVMLSDGSGPAAVRSIEAECGTIPTIYLTGTPENCDGCPPDRILSKPFSTMAFMELVTQIAPSAPTPGPAG